MELKEVIKNNLIYFRKQKNLSAERVAQVLNISRQAYSNYEAGIRDIGIESLKILANFYGVTLDLFTSSSLIDAREPSISFSTIKSEYGKLSFDDNPTVISNLNSSFIVVKLNDNFLKVFESNMVNVDNHEMLFEFNHELKIGKVYYYENGSGVILINNIPTPFSKAQSKSIVFIGMLLATINKEYDNNHFF